MQLMRALVIPVAALALLAVAAPAAAAVERKPLLRELPQVILEPWQANQSADGNFVRPSSSKVTDGFGNAALAYAMLQEAVRSNDVEKLRSAMSAWRWILTERVHPKGVFYRYFLAAGYNLARKSRAAASDFRVIRSAWVRHLRSVPYTHKEFGIRYRYNKHLVEAATVFELLASGVRSPRSGAILRNRAAAARRAKLVMGRQIPDRASDYSRVVGADEGWGYVARVADMSDPPDNPPAYNALVAAFYARAYLAMPRGWRTARMRATLRMLTRGVVSRTAPDGDIAFAGRSQEEAWALGSVAYAAWQSARLSGEHELSTLAAAGQRAIARVRREHVVGRNGDGFVLTPSLVCCERNDNPPGQDLYFELAAYSGLTAALFGWAEEARPAESATAQIPSDRDSTYFVNKGRGRFLQHRSGPLFWMMRMQSDFADARADMAVSVMKVRRPDGSWADVVPPRPYSGGHHRPADPAALCLVVGADRSGCAYLELHQPRSMASGGWYFEAAWRTSRRKVVREGIAFVEPTVAGLRLSWDAIPGDVFKIDHFLPDATCHESGTAGPGIRIRVTGFADCRIVATDYAGGSRVDLDRSRIVAGPGMGQVSVSYEVVPG